MNTFRDPSRAGHLAHRTAAIMGSRDKPGYDVKVGPFNLAVSRLTPGAAGRHP
jgi:hypothetical protein